MHRYGVGLWLILTILLGACGAIGGGERVEISIVYGSEKRAWLEEATAAFNDQRVRTEDGNIIHVTATPLGSNDALRQIVDGTLQPTVWSPASSILIPLANEAWASRNGGAALVEASPPLVLSPVVIAMWESMARALGWPDTPLGWADLAELARSGRSWADYGYPEWGRFQFGHTHPDYSNSGIASILAMAYAGSGKARGLSVDDVRQPAVAELIREVEGEVIHYGESTGFFAEQMFTRGPAYLSAAVLYENLVIEAHDRGRYPTLGSEVVAIYPEEGSFWSDHPFAILNAPWVGDEQHAAAERYRDFLLDRPQQERALQLGFRPANPNIPLAAPISAENGVDPAQPQTLLEVPGVPVIQAVQALWAENKKRVDVMVVLDTSGSMEEEGRLEGAKRALSEFIGQLNDEDGIGLTMFGSRATELSPLGPLGPKREELLTRIGGLFPAGQTRLVDTVREAYATLAAEPTGERIRAMVVLSDGADNQSASGAVERFVATLQADEGGTSIKVFTIAYGTGSDVNIDLLRTISGASGGQAYESSPDTIQQVYRQIATFF